MDNIKKYVQINEDLIDVVYYVDSGFDGVEVYILLKENGTKNLELLTWIPDTEVFLMKSSEDLKKAFFKSCV